MNGLAPTPKVATGLMAGAVSVIVVWILSQFHITMPNEVAQSFTVLISGLASYFAPHSDLTPEQKATIIAEHSTKP